MKKVENPALNLLLSYCCFYEQRTIEKIQELFCDDVVSWGTGVDEYSLGIDALKKNFLRDWSLSSSAKVSIVSNIDTDYQNPFWAAAFFRAEVVIDDELHVFENLRGTICVRQEKGMWKISHLHASFPDYRQSQGDSFPKVIKENNLQLIVDL